jgi:spore coat polysaccharide biosynthesis protein SpsF (cytidylyltransferase family)/radical SAM superfamily enzyme YgiQ (UPF0313 family)
MPKTIAIIQARMGATRLPGKMMLELGSKKVIDYVFERAEMAKNIDEVWLATTTSEQDNVLENWAKEKNKKYYRGSEKDVLDRYLKTAEKAGADVVVRITGDCPLSDFKIIDSVIEEFKNGNYDYVSNVHPPTYPDGLDIEVFSFDSLKKAWNEAKLNSEREHVTPYIWKNPEIFKSKNIENNIDLSEERWTLDTKEDYEFLKKVVEECEKSGSFCGMEEVLGIIKNNPQWKSINNMFERNEGYSKSIKEDIKIKKKLKIVLGDLKHDTIGRHSVFMPIGIGYITSYLFSKVGEDNVEVRLFDDPNELLSCVDEWNPDVIGLSNYCWNTNLSKVVFEYSKEKNPNIITISGGPEVPTDHDECEEYLLKRREIDLFVYREGEVAFSKLIKKILDGEDINDIKKNPQDGVMSINPETNKIIVGEVLPRINNLDEIPSPYLTGLMDKWFNGKHAPSIEIARGCPFTCGYCKASYDWFIRMTKFSIERIKQELEYMAKRMESYPDVLLSLCDSNFGMTEHDEKIAEYMNFLQNEYNWPNAFDVTTGKANYDRILRITSLLKNKMFVSVSVQTLNEKTLEVIRRRNMPLDKYSELQKEIKRRGMSAIAELIIPMPEETKESFFDSVRILLNTEVNSIVVYTLMLLKGTPMASKEFRYKYGMETKFRLLPRQFGEYKGRRCFEIEEVCIATNKMSFDEYLDCRGFALVSSLLADKQFDYTKKHIKELDIDIYDFVMQAWDSIKNNNNVLSDIYNKYIEETKNELFDSEEELLGYFSKQENYNKLLSVELGDNLMRKYSTKMLLEGCSHLIGLVYRVLNKLNKNKADQKIRESLDCAKQWVNANRNISEVINSKMYRDSVRLLNLTYDVNTWFLSDDSKPLTDYYRKNTIYKVYCDKDHIDRVLNEVRDLYGDDLFFCIGKYLINHEIREFWCETKDKIRQ